ncbi:hypothetical protein [Natranaerofaba carboxydovora]|uniref:hypothetical protein n=1 Tax=Natranaerofaba carboxydovora TaxID=2742683 RepID=UPI001F13B513|nr:hypothetical protein [Natranaerofaba carboxydovora]UMZ75172.1 hypothetical protein ACONDI_02787 [Natranaerofaba carboxydovora]
MDEKKGITRGKQEKKKKVFGLLIVFSALIAVFLFMQANPQFENPLIVFSSSGFEEKANYKLIEQDKGNKAYVKEVIPIRGGWMVQKDKDYEEHIIIIDDYLTDVDIFEVKSGGSLLTNVELMDKKRIIHSTENKFLTFDERGQNIAEINLEGGEKITASDNGILIGENNLEMEENIIYSEQLKWLDYEGNKIKELELEDLVIIEGVKSDNTEIDLYVAVSFSQSPNLELLRYQEGNIERKTIGMRVEEDKDTTIKFRDNTLAIGDNNQITLLKNVEDSEMLEEKLYEYNSEGNIDDFFLLADKILIILSPEEKDKDNELKLIEMSGKEIEVRKKRALRGEVLDVNLNHPNNFSIATTSHLYEFDEEDGLNIFRSPWGKAKLGTFDDEGNSFLVYEKDDEILSLYKKTKDN